MNRQKTILAVLLLVLAAALVYAYFRMPEQKTVKQLTDTTGTTAAVPGKGAQAAKPASNTLNLSLLDATLPSYKGFKRNIFTLATPETRKKLPPPPPPPSSPPPPPPPPPPSPSQIAQNEMATEMAKFTFLGFLLKDDRKSVFLQKNTEIFVVRKGDRLENRYVVTNVSNSALTIDSTSGGGQIVIPLIENQPLQTSRGK